MANNSKQNFSRDKSSKPIANKGSATQKKFVSKPTKKETSLESEKKFKIKNNPNDKKQFDKIQHKNNEKPSDESMPLNKYIAHCGICSRRDAVELIKKGKIKVNSLIEDKPGTKVTSNDYIFYNNNRIFPQTKLVYYLLNKPKNYITTTDDPEKRKTVLDIFKNENISRLYPVGRLDRNTTGLLLLTNDGDLAQKLTHPKYNIKKVYQVTLDKPLHKNDYNKILKGLLLEDGLAEVDEIAYLDLKNKKEIGVQIHSGKNRIVRRIFEHLHYSVTALDRVVYAGLTKKNIPRGSYRLLENKEVIYLKHFNNKYLKKE